MKEKKKKTVFLSFSQAHCHHYIALLSRCASLYNMNMICESKKRVAFEFSEQWRVYWGDIWIFIWRCWVLFFLLACFSIWSLKTHHHHHHWHLQKPIKSTNIASIREWRRVKRAFFCRIFRIFFLCVRMMSYFIFLYIKYKQRERASFVHTFSIVESSH
jgi:hypothetical protein